MNDKEFLQWIYDRLKNVHGENEHYDYMQKLKVVIKEYNKDNFTPW